MPPPGPLYGSRVEDDWTRELIQEMGKLGFEASLKPSFHLVIDGRHGRTEPDIEITNGGVSIGSAKIGEDHLPEALATAHEYQVKLERADELRGIALKEVFAIVYPRTNREPFHLIALPHSRRPTNLFFTPQSLPDLAQKIALVIRNEVAGVLQTPVLSAVPKVMYYGAKELAQTLSGIPQEDLEEVFGGHSFFQAVLATRLKGKDRTETLRLGAGFLFVNQLFFYILLSRAAEQEYGVGASPYPSIADIDKDNPQRINDNYFEKVHAKDYEPIYGIPVARLFKVKRAAEACREIVNSIVTLSPNIDSRDIAGQVFQTLIPFDIRKPLGANYTNPRAAELLADLAIDRADASVMDPACGSGTLLVSAYLRKVSLSKETNKRKVHRQFVENDITGIDAMAFAAHLAAVNLALQEPLMETDRLRIATTDSTRLKPGDDIVPTEEALPAEFRQSTLEDRYGDPSMHLVKAQRTRGPVRMKKVGHEPTAIHLDSVDLVMMNPPFTSRDNMSITYRIQLAELYSAGEYGVATSGRKISQQAYFLLLADKFLRPGGKIASVLPLTTLGGKDYWPLVDFLCKHYTIQYVVVGMGRTAFSEDTSLSECLLVAKKSPPPVGSTFRLVGTLLPPDDWNGEKQSKLVEGCRKGQGIDDISVIREFPQTELSPGGQMLPGLVLRLLPEYDTACSALERTLTTSRLPIVKFAELRRRGIVYRGRLMKARHFAELGASALFACRQEERALRLIDRLYLESQSADKTTFRDRISGATIDYSSREVVPALRRFAYVPNLDITTSSDFCVKVVGDPLRDSLESIYGKEDGVRKWKHLKNRGFWEQVVDGNSARLIAAQRLNLAAPGTTMLCCWSATPVFLASPNYMAEGFQSTREEHFFCMWLNSSLGVLQVISATASTQGSWVRMERFTVDQISLPDYSRFTEDDWVRSEQLWAGVSKTPLPSLLEQVSTDNSARKRLDDGLLQLMGIEGADGRKRIGQAVREGIKRVLESMRKAMGSEPPDFGDEANNVSS